MQRNVCVFTAKTYTGPKISKMTTGLHVYTVHFFAVNARLQHELPDFMLYRQHVHTTTNFLVSFILEFFMKVEMILAVE